jgi:hypothetical protein
MSSIVGGCIIYYFAKEDFSYHDSFNSNHNTNMDFDHEAIELMDNSNRVILYAWCGLTTSFGSIIKGALLCPISQIILSGMSWTRDPRNQSSYLRFFLFTILHHFEHFAQNHNRLAWTYICTYGKTLCRSSQDLATNLDIFILLQDDMTSFSLKIFTIITSSVISILMTILAEKKEGTAWPFFLILCYFLSYSAISLPIHFFRSAVDGLLVAFTHHSDRFATINPIVFQRFYRVIESTTPTLI